jgi:hypothetical protein
MPQILNKGHTYSNGDQVTSSNLNSLVDLATFAATCVVGGGGLELSGGALQIANTSITPTKLSAGAPTWDTSNNLTVNGTLTTGGTISTSNDLAVNGVVSVTGASTFTGNATFAGQIIRSGTASNRTVQLKTGATSPNAISFGWDNGDLLVTVDGTEYKVTLTPV